MTRHYAGGMDYYYSENLPYSVRTLERVHVDHGVETPVSGDDIARLTRG